jgi:hypothetical protein
MPYAKKTLTDLKQSIADRHDSGILPTSSVTLAFWTRLLNRGQAYCADKLRLLKSTTLTTSSGSVSMPDDFLTISRVYDSSENELAQVDQEDLACQVAGTFWITGNHFDDFKLNTTEDKAYTVEYTFRPAEMVNNTDECIIPDPESVVSFAYAMLRKSETDPIGDADAALQECDSRLNEMQSAYNINSNFTGFIIPDAITTKFSWE